MDPQLVVGFVVARSQARRIAARWMKRAWFTPSAFGRAQVDEVRGVYVPAYLYSAAARVEYTAEIGEHYTVTETYTTTDANGKTVTRTRTKTVTEWRDLAGAWAAYVDDVVVTASRGLGNAELEAVEPFDMRALRRYDAKLLSGWIAEDPSRTSRECQQLAHGEAVAQVGRRLSAHMPGDHHRNLRYSTTFVHENLALALVPVWIMAVRYDEEKPPVRLVINGQTGRLAGRPPRSWLKIAALVVSVIAALALAYAIVSLS